MIALIRKSILIKLLLILGVAGVIIELFVFSGLRFLLYPHAKMRSDVEKDVKQFGLYLVKDIGDPPNLIKAASLARELNMGIRISGGGIDWTSSPSLPNLSEIETFCQYEERDVISMGRCRLQHFMTVDTRIKESPAKFIFFLPLGPKFAPRLTQMVTFFMVLTLILGVSFIVIKRELSPLKSLTEGVDAVSHGKFTHLVPVQSPDELGRLATSFNQMSSRLKEMIEGKERLLMDVSHELRSPITRAKLALEFAGSDKSALEETRKDLDEMEHMIKQLLESARMDSGYGELRLVLIDIPPLVKELVGHYADRLPQVAIVEMPGILMVPADEERLRAVVRNVLENALKYTPADKKIEVRVRDEGERVVIEVEDQGIGIPVNELEKVFEPFYRVDRSRTRKTGGFGLGLSLCRKIMRAHHGDIFLRSQEGRGTLAVMVLRKGLV